ncbi:hypothetical protein [Calothrix sp. PCC 7507]|uniref:hypothetical protein n=1 Tax=Calothrix sp. PCC 7507 TaxID=99598 RepID=UPI00029F4E1E|nr:hypothetical protein [Calothrix sp. PCC 7507]AFY31907.1 hypothetical protein Cal7507_1442 [Calothrix sp. PCC 7507]AFY31913.1 hypothetical protein Cal7507_1448 [Calothrix sp. PCC 7507]
MSSGIYQILEKIKARPGMYIGRASVNNLFIFLAGYKIARRELGIELTEEEKDFCDKFHDFVEQKYKLHTSNSWAKIIMLYCQDEKAGLARFFKLLDEFKTRDKNLSHEEEVAAITHNVTKK